MKIISWLNKHVEELLLSISLIVLVLIMGLQVFMRYIMNNSLAWPEELSRYIFIWFTYIGVSYAIHKGVHLHIDLLFNYVSKSVKKVFETISDILFLLFLVVAIYGGIEVTNSLFASQQTSPGLGLTMAFVYLALPVGSALGVIRIIQSIWTRFKKSELESEDQIV